MMKIIFNKSVDLRSLTGQTGSMKMIPLLKGIGFTKEDKQSQATPLFAIVDDEDFEFLSQWQWTACKTVDGNVYARRLERINRVGKWFTMHRLIMQLPESQSAVDHKDRNTLNNQKSNLRLATDNQNQGNRGINKNNRSGFKGVTWSKPAKKWQAQIMIHREHKYLGLFDNPETAARTYDRAAIHFFGEFARTNKQLGLLQ